jgi:hypothetical protein
MMDERVEKAIDDYEIRENIGFKWLLNNRLMVINMSFDGTDKQRIKSALWTTFTMLTPYMNDRFKKCRCKKKLRNLDNIDDKEEFIMCAHDVYTALLKIMYEHDMLFTEIPTVLG